MLIFEEAKETLRNEASNWPEDGRLAHPEDCTAYLWRERSSGLLCDVFADGGFHGRVECKRRKPRATRTSKWRDHFLREFRAVACAWRRTPAGKGLLPETSEEIFEGEGKLYRRLPGGSYERYDSKASGRWLDPEKNT